MEAVVAGIVIFVLKMLFEVAVGRKTELGMIAEFVTS
jgi:hypothetical protein